MSDSYYRTLLIDGKNRKLQELADLASKERTPAKAKQYADQAQAILRDVDEIDAKLAFEEGPAGLDYRDDAEMNFSIIRFLTHSNRPASEEEITADLIRGQFRGYKDKRKMAIRVGRCVRAYAVGRASSMPKLRVRNNLVGLADWPNEMFS
ncbi:MAG TPA: hypothetical protein VM554_01800 [Acidisarcina sp.]|nr:hypothetical protein [Acidisarcina sp.]